LEVTGPVEYVSDHACGSFNKLQFGIKHSTNKTLTLQGWWPATSSAESEGAVFSLRISGPSHILPCSKGAGDYAEGPPARRAYASERARFPR
jgi:hypothetical protein